MVGTQTLSLVINTHLNVIIFNFASSMSYHYNALSNKPSVKCGIITNGDRFVFIYSIALLLALFSSSLSLSLSNIIYIN